MVNKAAVRATITVDDSHSSLSSSCSSTSSLRMQVVASLVDENKLAVDAILQQPISVYASLIFHSIRIPLSWRVFQLLDCYEFSIEN